MIRPSFRRMTQAVGLSAALGLSGLGAASAQDLPPLEKNPTVLQGFYSIGLADEVRKNCDSISPRLIRAISFLQSLKGYASDAGYSGAQIAALQKNKQAKEALKTRIRADLAKRGASPDSPQGYCQVGHEEIAQDTQAGRLLRVN